MHTHYSLPDNSSIRKLEHRVKQGIPVYQLGNLLDALTVSLDKRCDLGLVGNGTIETT